MILLISLVLAFSAQAQELSFRLLFNQTSHAGANSIQGMAVYGQQLVQFHDHNTAMTVYDLPDGSFRGEQALDSVKTWHNNNVNFSTLFYKKGDSYPLLYAGQENSNEHKVVVWRITEKARGCFAAEIVQTILLPEPMKMGVYYPNIMLDNEAGKLYLTGFSRPSWRYATEGNGVQMLRFSLPSLSAGAQVQLSTEDIEARFCGEFRVATQGAVIRKGRLYQAFGVPKYGQTSVVCTDVNTGVRLYECALVGVPGEPEGLSFWEDKLVLSTYDGGVFISNPVW